MNMLYEQYRPRTWDELVGHGHVRKSVQMMKKRGSLGGHAFFITGPSGTGKSTIAMLIASEVADDFCIMDLDASGISSATVNDIERNWRTKALGTKPGRAFVINECHALRQDAIRQLLVTLERLPDHVVVIFTTTNAGQQRLFSGIDAHPLVSRCIEFNLHANQHVDAFAARAREIAETEGLGGADIQDYKALVKSCQYNFRQVLSKIEAGECFREALC